ncbi:MAG: hypothetical protein H0X43_05565 [Nitrosospira sp.]|nr:hypothetical protein [Nitrosospira sp.]
MAFDNEDWTRRLKLAKTGEEIRAMIMELPDGPSTPEDGQESSSMDQRRLLDL